MSQETYEQPFLQLPVPQWGPEPRLDQEPEEELNHVVIINDDDDNNEENNHCMVISTC